MIRLPKLSITTLVTSSLIAAIVSGIVGALINGYVTRSKPHIAVVSVGFEGDMIKVSDEVQKASRNDAWGHPLETYVHFDVLVEREQLASQVLARLEEARNHVDEWLGLIKDDESLTQFTKSGVKNTPYIGKYTILIGSSLLGELRRRSLPELPVALEEVIQHDRLWPLNEDESGWRLHLQNEVVTFPKDDAFSDSERNQQELIAESFSRGIVENIVHSHEIFSRTAADEFIALDKLREAIRSDLASRARIVVSLSLSNLGGTPLVLEPYLIAQATSGQDSHSFALQVVDPDGGGSAAQQEHLPGGSDDQREESGVKVLVGEFLQTSGGAPYVAVGPGESKRFEAISVSPIGEQGSKIVNYYELGDLGMRVVGQSVTGKTVGSTLAVFGKVPSEAKSNQLEKLVKAL